MFKTIENYFIGQYSMGSIVVQRKSKTYLYFVMIICAVLILTTTTMTALSVYSIQSVEFFSRASLIIIGLGGLVLLRKGRYYGAANLLAVGATLAMALPMFLGAHETELSLFISIIIPYLFIISAALLGTRLTIVIVGILTILQGAGAVLLNDMIDGESARKMIGTHVALTAFILIQCYLILRNIISSMRTMSEEMEKNSEKTGVIVKLLNNAQNLSESLASSSSELSSTATQFSDNAQSQATSVEEITASMEEMSAGIENISASTDLQSGTMNFLMEKMQEFTKAIIAMKSEVEAMYEKVQAIMDSAQNSNKTLELMNRSMTNIENSSSEITGIINIINDISDQINLLSLNAAIEAARAGDAGRGFAVVADEISKLADRTSESVKNIGELIGANENDIADGKSHVSGTVETIKSITDGITDNFEFMQTIASRMESQLKANQVINQKTEEAQEKTEEIKSAIREHKVATDEIVDTVSSINELSLANSAGAEETLSSTEELSKMAADLKELINSIDTDRS